MKKLLIILLSMAIVSQALSQEDCRKRLEEYMKGFPASDLCDVYKFCFQDVFGPEHLGADSAKAVAFINQELEKSKVLGGPDWQPAGCEGRYVRVNLRLVKEGVLSVEEMTRFLLQSMEMREPVDMQEWRYRWSQLEQMLNTMEPRPGHFALDSDAIESLLGRGGYVVHHSYSFNSTYNFHYRLVEKGIFEREIAPRLKKR